MITSSARDRQDVIKYYTALHQCCPLCQALEEKAALHFMGVEGVKHIPVQAMSGQAWGLGQGRRQQDRGTPG